MMELQYLDTLFAVDIQKKEITRVVFAQQSQKMMEKLHAFQMVDAIVQFVKYDILESKLDAKIILKMFKVLI
jgi:hypothetical protein